jgi:hypothetical protein
MIMVMGVMDEFYVYMIDTDADVDEDADIILKLMIVFSSGTSTQISRLVIN